MAEATQQSKDLIARFKRLKSDRTTVQQMWDAIEEFVTPYRGRMFQTQKNEHTIDWFKSRKIFDSTAVMAHQNLSASIHGSLTSPTIKWFGLRFRSAKLNENKAAIKWLQDASDAIHHELVDSNFDLEVNKVYQDITGYGTAAMVLEEAPTSKGDWNGLNFISVPLKEVFFELDWKNQPSRFYRCVEWTPQQMISLFGSENVPECIRDKDKDGVTDKQEVLFCVYPRNNKIMKWGEKVSPKRRPWEFCYLLPDSGEMVGKPGGYYAMPAFITRWETTNSSQWGHSPSMYALGDVLTLNQIVKTDLRAKAKTIDPPIFAEERAVISDLSLEPATLNMVRNVQGIIPFQSGHSTQDSDVAIARLQSNIRNYFMVDRIDFPDLQPQPMTATEAQIRYERMQRYMGATLAHLRNDLLNPIVERAFNILVRNEQIAEPPQSVIDEGGMYDIEYMGSLTRAQQIDEVTAIERTAAAAADLGQAFPDALDTLDASESVRLIGRKLNAPASIIRDKNEVMKVQKERAQMQERMMEAQAAEAEGAAMKTQGEAAEVAERVDGEGGVQ